MGCLEGDFKSGIFVAARHSETRVFYIDKSLTVSCLHILEGDPPFSGFWSPSKNLLRHEKKGFEFILVEHIEYQQVRESSSHGKRDATHTIGAILLQDYDNVHTGDRGMNCEIGW